MVPMRIARLKDVRLATLLVHDAPELVSDTLIACGEWEPFETRVLMAALTPGATFVDVGANVGYFSCLAAGIVGPHGRVVAVEPEPDNLALLERNVQALDADHVEIARVALDDVAGRTDLWLCPENRGDHSLIAADGRVPRQIETCRGDDILTGRVDAIKIDVQGAEARVLRGLVETLARERRRIVLLIEFSPWALAALGDTSHSLLAPLEALDMTCWIVDHEGGRLVPATFDDLHALADTIMAPATRGFMNILVAPREDQRFARFIQG